MLSQKQLDKQIDAAIRRKQMNSEMQIWFSLKFTCHFLEVPSNLARKEDKKTIESDRNVLARDQIKISWIFNQQLW